MIKARIKALRYAFSGLKDVFQNEIHFKIHISITLLIIALSILLKLSTIEWSIILMSIVSVLSLEIINTAIEIMCNYVQPQQHPTIKRIKDLSAAAVLTTVVGVIIIGLIIFIPKIILYVTSF